MLDSNYAITFGLTESQNKIVRIHLKEMECGLVEAADYEALMDAGYFMSIVSRNALDEEACRKLTAFYTELDGNLTERIMIADQPDRLSEASRAIVFRDFEELEPELGKILEKAHKKAKKEENTISNLSDVFTILREIRRHPGITAEELSEKIHRNHAAVRRFVEVLRVMGEEIAYDWEKKGFRCTGNAVRMKIDHAALYVKDLEGMKEFYRKYFGASANEKYHNKKTGLETYFLTFSGEGRLEIMTRPGLCGDGNKEMQYGYAHLAFNAGSRQKVDELTEQLRKDGYTVLSGPRTTGDGYYESRVLDGEGNQIEVVECNC